METDAESGAAAPARPDGEVETAGKPGKARTPGRERGGPSGPEPTRYGDWERKGIARDF